MIRVISGRYRGRTLAKLSTSKTRPTLARVRKSLLQILEPFTDKVVLDLFAGTGILGIESLSRGAKKLVSIENDHKVHKILNKNLDKICSGDNYIALRMDAIKYLLNCNDKFDIILCDPPYNKYNYMEIFNNSIPNIRKGGVFCMEMKKQTVDLNKFKVKIYGDTQVVLWRNNE